MIHIATLQSNHGHRTAIGYDFHAFFKELAERGEADACIVSTEEGFSPLGASRDFFSRDLGISYEDEIKPLANWNRFENERITLVALCEPPTGQPVARPHPGTGGNVTLLRATAALGSLPSALSRFLL